MFAERIDFSHEANLSIDELVKRAEVLLPDGDMNLLRKCFEFAEKMHAGVKRSSGELYIIHPLNVAGTLIKLKMDLDAVMAGLLHDTVEDCDVSPEDIAKKFGQNVAQIVVGCTKISKIKF